MAKEKTTFIKIDRNILEWRWYKEPNTVKLFLHLLLKANIKDKDFMTETIHRGELATSYATLAAESGLTVSQARTALKHLEETGEVTVRRHSKFSVISIPEYDYYQSQNAGKRQSLDNHIAITSQQSKNNKEILKNGEERARETRSPEDASPGLVFIEEMENGMRVYERPDGTRQYIPKGAEI